MATLTKQLIEKIAEICHEANRAYCTALGDFSQDSWIAAPDWQKESARAGVQFIADHPEAGPAASHDNWLRQKYADGWTYGDYKNPQEKTHPCLVPFDHLPVDQQAKDHIFRSIVLTMIDQEARL